MRLDVPNLSVQIEEELVRQASWMHPYHFGGNVYAGTFKHHDLPTTITTRDTPEPVVARFREAFEDYMRADPFHDLDTAVSEVEEALGASVAVMSALDNASATGRFSFRLAQLGTREVVGVEIRPEQVEQAELVHRAAANLRDIPVRFEQDPVSADSPEYRLGESYDLVLSLGLLYHLSDPLQHLANLGRLAERAVVVHMSANVYGKPGLWQPLQEDPGTLTKAVGGISWSPYFRDLPRLLLSAGFRQVGWVEHPLVRGLRPPLHVSPLRRFAALVTPPVVSGAVTRAKARVQADARRRAARGYQNPFQFTLWAVK